MKPSNSFKSQSAGELKSICSELNYLSKRQKELREIRSTYLSVLKDIIVSQVPDETFIKYLHRVTNFSPIRLKKFIENEADFDMTDGEIAVVNWVLNKGTLSNFPEKLFIDYKTI